MCLRKWIIPLVILGSVFNLNSTLKSLKEAEGFEMNFFSSKTGDPYFRIKYQNIFTERPKVGFLKFGLAFLNVSDLKITIDLSHVEAMLLQSKWDEIAKNRAINYATINPVNLTLVDGNRISHHFSGPKAKFISSGEFRVWGKVTYQCNDDNQEFDEVVMFQDKEKNQLVIRKTKNGFDPLVLNFPIP